MNSTLYRIAADAVLTFHWSFVTFEVLGLILILVGGVCGWAWVKNPWFRWMHLLAIGVVVVQSWFGIVCPLTDLEMALREHAGDAVYQGSFIAHWMQELLYFDAPNWVFAVCYTAFSLLVIASWVFVRPRPWRQRHDASDLAANTK